MPCSHMIAHSRPDVGPNRNMTLYLYLLALFYGYNLVTLMFVAKLCTTSIKRFWESTDLRLNHGFSQRYMDQNPTLQRFFDVNLLAGILQCNKWFTASLKLNKQIIYIKFSKVLAVLHFLNNENAENIFKYQKTIFMTAKFV